VGLVELKLEPDRATELGDRLFPLPWRAKRTAEIVLGSGEAGLAKRDAQRENRAFRILAGIR
jgi:hypothetical protein